ncbi:hypothetical protein OG417_44770 [Actinoallomurus sp. NBC_01490]|uniref:hypothetical protein n=1 Tax=Actinoallomurus sp. NBC_01490 TaxID=2903557 RepID=UPI002E3055C1|nr:hypothetical protein [Actinoallomurus sp. NBC_01490]
MVLVTAQAQKIVAGQPGVGTVAYERAHRFDELGNAPVGDIADRSSILALCINQLDAPALVASAQRAIHDTDRQETQPFDRHIDAKTDAAMCSM